MQKQEVSGVKYAFDIHQQDTSLPFLLMLHGFMGDSRAFNHLLENFKKFCNPITIDLLGHGQSQKVYDPQRYYEARQVADLKKIINTVLDSPPFIYGYSMGGRLALKTVVSDPDSIQGIILESTNPGITDKQNRTERKAIDVKRAQEIRSNYSGFLENWEKLELFESPLKKDPEISEAYKDMHLQQDPEAIAASLVGFGTGFMEPVTDDKLHFESPVLLLAGSKDHKYIAINKRVETFFSCASNHIIKAGHRVHLDNPPALTKLMNSFIEQNA